MTALYDRNFMENCRPRYSEYASFAIRGRQCLQHGGAPPHVGRKITEFLNEHFDEGGLETNGPVAWPGRSPALNPLDLFLWDCMKSRVYHNGKPEGRQQLV